MSFTVEIPASEIKKFRRDIGFYSDAKKAAVRKAVTRGLFAIQKTARKKAPVGVSGDLRSKILPHPDADGLGGSVDATAPYSIYVEFGRGPGKQPPVRALQLWAKRKLGDENAAFAIARHIGKYGTNPHPFMRPAGRDNMNAIMADIREAMK